MKYKTKWGTCLFWWDNLTIYTIDLHELKLKLSPEYDISYRQYKQQNKRISQENCITTTTIIIKIKTKKYS